MIVADTNIICYLYLDGPLHPAAQSLAARDPDWRAPTLWRSEFRNVLVGEVRRGSIQWERAKSLAAAATSFLRYEYKSDNDAVLDLAARSICTAYDLEYVALALQLRAPLVTMDKQLLREFPTLARPLIVP